MGPETRDGPPPKPRGPKRLHLRHAGTCVACGVAMAVGDEALWDPDARTVRCVECPTGATQPPIDPSVAGASAQREYEHRRAGREARTKDRYGRRLGGIVLALTDEPASTRAWARGAGVDAKRYEGRIHIRDVGGLFKTDKRLYVGSRDCSKLADDV